ncbi:MAG: hypothetical protein MUF35_05925 [Candidatus Nanopelagicales bacterium]|nr:hypothetical protein [Candidatus Nanopelagicales bacterium]
MAVDPHVPPDLPRRLGRSTVSFGLAGRLALTVLALLPPWLVVRFVAALLGLGDAGASAGSPLLDVPLAALGVMLSAHVPRYLRDVWRTNPDWRRHDHAAFVLQQRAQDALDKERAPARGIAERRGARRW